jgi:transposase
MANIGRPTKLTPELTEKICSGLRSGLYLKDAADLAGIHPSQVNRWIARGSEEGSEGPHAAFRAAIKKAEAETQVATLEIIRQAAEGGNWTAAAWYLERRHPEKWGRHGRDAREGLQEAREGEEQTKADAEVVMSKLRALTSDQGGQA